MYIRELSVQYRLRLMEGEALCSLSLTEPVAAATLLTRLIGTEAVEVCGVLCLSTRRDVLAYHELSRGTLDATMVHPRDVLRTALLANARAVIIGHNHPSGDVSPGPDDSAVTHRLAQAAKVVGIQLVDHLIVSAEGRYFSFLEAGLLIAQ